MESDLKIKKPFWKRYLNRLVASEISNTTRYFDDVIEWVPLPHDNGLLIEQIEAKAKTKLSQMEELPDLSQQPEQRTALIMNGTFNHCTNIQDLIAEIKPKLSRNSRIIAVAYNPYLAWLYRLANFLGLRQGEMPSTFLTRTDLSSIAKIAGYEVVRVRPTAYSPFKFLGLGSLANSIFPSLPIVRWLGLATVIILRPIVIEKKKPSLSIVIPARNEKGNIENALKRMPDLGGAEIEVLFVEGHSQDDTWLEIQRVAEKYRDQFKIKTLQQTGKGKVDAVRLGFSHANGDLLTILDADLTMPPELLGRFYDAYCNGYADFVNGNRLVYPMEGKAMRFLNHLGNIFFAKALSSVLDTRLGDTLCGTKLLARHDYARFEQWRADFGDFDPFGDFELLFPAAVMGLGIVDIPIRYLDRTYGSTNISRFRHGIILLKMTLIGLFKIRMTRRWVRPQPKPALLNSH